ncbi:MAG TPA: Gfo/Idh/MocA family oxidoreductase, partial [Candidatus Limnocylindrales bacterium]
SRITAFWGDDDSRTAPLAKQYGVNLVVETPAALASEVDAALIVTRHGGVHLDQALPLVRAGLPVFIDKPLACSVADATAILDAARASESLVLSARALRWQPDTEIVASRMLELGGPVSIVVTGTFYPENRYGGAYFYGIHAAELALELAGSEITDLMVETAGPDGAVVIGRAGDIDVTVRLLPPASPDDIRFHVEVNCRDGGVARNIGLGDDYMAPVLDRFMEMAATGKPPLTRDQMLTPIRILEVAERALRVAA